jgi:putative ABC transport system permease protein
LLWAGGALFIMRIARLAVRRDARVVARALAPGSGRLSRSVGISLSRDWSALGRGVTLVAIAIAFAFSTAIFNSTYERQSLVDAQLTNGADVAVQSNGSVDLTNQLDSIRALPGVTAAEPMQHRFAYVGSDLQDMYGIDPATLTSVAPLSDAFFAGGSAQEMMKRLTGTPDGVLVSPETVTDYQLQLGDTVKLQLQSAVDHQYHPVEFHYVGIAREFPTAPSDSFLVANADYIAQQTGSAAVATVLIKTNQSPAGVAGRVREQLGPTSGATVRDIDASRQTIRSSLTAVSLHGLTRIELGLAVLLAVAGASLVIILGLEERRRSLAIIGAIGGTPRQVGAFVWSQAAFIVVAGIAGGAALGWIVAYMLVKLLTHVFDPPPTSASIPWAYLALVLTVTAGAIWMAARNDWLGPEAPDGNYQATLNRRTTPPTNRTTSTSTATFCLVPTRWTWVSPNKRFFAAAQNDRGLGGRLAAGHAPDEMP